MEAELPAAVVDAIALASDVDGARQLAREALTHRTWVNEHPHAQQRDNQRLELLGDAVLELIVTRMLFEALPHADEGLLSRARASVVNEAALAAGARAIALGPALLLGRGEVASGGNDRPRTLADALEAMIAAVYLAAGLDAAASLVERALGDHVRETIEKSAPRAASASSAIDARVKDAKSVLQELVQREGAAPPTYELEATEGPVHERTFRVRAIVRGEVVGVGEGRSRRDAEMRAASQAIEKLRAIPREPSDDPHA
jgi:ribonuclease-3